MIFENWYSKLTRRISVVLLNRSQTWPFVYLNYNLYTWVNKNYVFEIYFLTDHTLQRPLLRDISLSIMDGMGLVFIKPVVYFNVEWYLVDSWQICNHTKHPNCNMSLCGSLYFYPELYLIDGFMRFEYWYTVAYRRLTSEYTSTIMLARHWLTRAFSVISLFI